MKQGYRADCVQHTHANALEIEIVDLWCAELAAYPQSRQSFAAHSRDKPTKRPAVDGRQEEIVLAPRKSVARTVGMRGNLCTQRNNEACAGDSAPARGNDDDRSSLHHLSCERT